MEQVFACTCVSVNDLFYGCHWLLQHPYEFRERHLPGKKFHFNLCFLSFGRSRWIFKGLNIINIIMFFYRFGMRIYIIMKQFLMQNLKQLNSGFCRKFVAEISGNGGAG